MTQDRNVKQLDGLSVATQAQIGAVLTSPTASQWLKDALRTALKRDPVDAANDAEYLASILADVSVGCCTRGCCTGAALEAAVAALEEQR